MKCFVWIGGRKQKAVSDEIAVCIDERDSYRRQLFTRATIIIERDGICRHPEGQRARRRDRLSAQPVGKPGAAADRIEVAFRGFAMGSHVKTARLCLAVLL